MHRQVLDHLVVVPGRPWPFRLRVLPEVGLPIRGSDQAVRVMATEIVHDVDGRAWEVTDGAWAPVSPVGQLNGDAAPPVDDPIPSNGDKPAGSTIRASDVVAKKAEWLWPDRVPLGMPTVFGGFPGVGKSTILYDLAARTSREGKSVLVVTAEDHLAVVVRPRLEAAGADLNLVHILTVPLTLPEGVGLLGRLVRELGAALVILDPLVAFIGDTVNTHRDHHVRRVLAPLADLAEETMAAVVVVIHTNKGEGSEPLMRISGSIGFTGAARSVLLAADDPQDESRRILAVVKSNLAQFPPPLAYRIAGVALDNEITTSRIEWLGEAPEVDVRALLARRDGDERSALAEATEFLRDAGVTETARLAKDLERDAEKGLGIHRRTLRRAREALNVPAWREGFGAQGRWYWGPRPEDTHRGHGTPVPLSPLVQPAETGAAAPIGDTSEGVGDPVQNGEARTTFEVMSSSESEEWYTPADVVDRVLEVLGEVDLDPCTNPGQPTVPAKLHYRKADDGLAHRWEGRVFMNPPYGQAIPAWIRKLTDEYRWGHIDEAIALVPARPDTQWFAMLDGFLRCEIRGRVKFNDGKRGRMYSAPFPSAVFYLGPNTGRFIEVFSGLGRIVQPVEGRSTMAQAISLIEREFDAVALP